MKPDVHRILSQRRVTAVLRVANGSTQSTPSVCVVTGAPTINVVKQRADSLPGSVWLHLLLGSTLAQVLARLMRRPSADVVISVSAPAWRAWRSRLAAAVMFATAGVGMIVAGVILGNAGWVWVGVLVLLGASIARVRTVLHRWVSLDYRPDSETVRVIRAHSAFDAEARRLFTRHLGGM